MVSVFPAAPSAERGAERRCVAPQVRETLALIGEAPLRQPSRASASPAGVLQAGTALGSQCSENSSDDESASGGDDWRATGSQNAS